MLPALIVAHEWGVKPSAIFDWSEADVLMAYVYLKWKNRRD